MGRMTYCSSPCDVLRSCFYDERETLAYCVLGALLGLSVVGFADMKAFFSFRARLALGSGGNCCTRLIVGDVSGCMH